MSRVSDLRDGSESGLWSERRQRVGWRSLIAIGGSISQAISAPSPAPGLVTGAGRSRQLTASHQRRISRGHTLNERPDRVALIGSRS